MHFEEAVEFLGLPYSSFMEIVPTLPRHAITLARFEYRRRELLAWGKWRRPLRRAEYERQKKEERAAFTRPAPL